MRAGIYVNLLSFFSAASGHTQPITPAAAERVAAAQHKATVAAPGGATAPSPTTSKKAVSLGSIGVAVLVVAVLATALVTPAAMRRRAGGPAAASPEPPLTR